MTKLAIGAIGLAVTVIAGEHYFSTYLSSPWTVDKFSQTKEDERKVWKMFFEAALWSGGFAFVMAIMLGTIWPIIGACVVIAGYWYVYKRALEHTL